MKTGLALGSNLGDRQQQLRKAKVFLQGLSRDGTCLASPIYETEPVDCPPDSPAFLNAVMEIDCDLAPQELLEKIQAYEKGAGRDRTDETRNAPRSVDMDILYCDGLEMQQRDLIIPHPRMTQRRFVLEPLAAIRPDLVLPGQVKTVEALLRELPGMPLRVIMGAAW